jgi:hypothetical protein
LNETYEKNRDNNSTAQCFITQELKLLHFLRIGIGEAGTQCALDLGDTGAREVARQCAGDKFAVAQMLAQMFPVDLETRLPPKRRPWMSEDPRMNIFDAVDLAIAFWPQNK